MTSFQALPRLKLRAVLSMLQKYGGLLQICAALFEHIRDMVIWALDSEFCF